MLEIGYPRNDVLFEKNNKDDIRLLKKKLGLPENKKIILYAPTWRDNDYYGKGNYKFQLKLDFDRLREELSDDYIIIVKYHYLVSSEIDWSPYEGFVYDFGRTDDISELYLVSDMMITDYSSVMFDYSLLNRPMFFYCYDLAEYRDTLRGFYFDFEAEAPGPISENTEALINDIKNYNSEDYAEKYAAYHEKFNAVDDGHASEQIVQLIENIAHDRPGVVTEEPVM
jgi:CDP-glycerol glycerophosphotransferase